MSSVQVSIVMPAYNASVHIVEAVRSVQNQSFVDWELLFSDDNSSDETVKIAQQFAEKDSRIRIFVREKNQGAAGARNVAISAAKGRYIAFLDSDDVWHADKLEKQIGLMRAQNLSCVFSSYDRIDQSGNYLNTRRCEGRVTYEALLKSNTIGCLTAIYDTEAVGKILMPDIRRRQDFACWLQILKKIKYAVPIEESLASYRVGTGTVSSNKFAAARATWDIYFRLEKLGFTRSVYYFVHYAAIGVYNYLVVPNLARVRRRSKS